MFEKDGLKNPLTMYYHESYERQEQKAPGIQAEMTPIPDCGEKSYKGCGRLRGRKALVTGGDSGIGRAAAIAFAREGADVVINYLPEEQKDAEAVKEIIEQSGQKVILMPGDITSEAFCEKLVAQAADELGGLDILALVAGMQQNNKNIETLETEQFVKTFETNVFALFWLTKAALKVMKAGSSIIATSSVQAYQPGEILLDYAATKSAIIGYTRALAKQVAEKGIRANVVAPGPVWTPLQITGGQPQENIPEFGKEVPLKRAGQPAELAGVYVFLASDEASYVTAQVYGVTGGMLTA